LSVNARPPRWRQALRPGAGCVPGNPSGLSGRAVSNFRTPSNSLTAVNRPRWAAGTNGP